jgi:hypothetical protein
LFEFRLAVRKPTSADELEKFAECKPRPTGKSMVLAEHKPRPAGNSFDKVTGTFTIGVQTQHVIRELREDPLNDEQRTWADVKLLFMRAN